MKYIDILTPSPVQELTDTLLDNAGVRLYVKRDDLIHQEISGNKWRKLKFNIAQARQQNASAILSFGGAYSNHLYALATFGELEAIETIGIVRGHELTQESSFTLRHCSAQGMELHFVTRTDYRMKEAGAFVRTLTAGRPNLFIVPEGGTNRLALRGVGEIIDECEDTGITPDYYVTPAGTGGTAAGLLCRNRNVLAVAVLKGAGFLKNDINKWLSGCGSAGRLDLQTGYHFGGYGKYDSQLLRFISNFELQHNIPLEQVYSGKMFYGLFDLIKRGYFARGTTLMALHTGGLQGKLKP